MEDTPKGIQIPLNNLGRIISLREEQGKSLNEVASAMGMTKEGWRQIEIAYNKTYQSAVERLKHPAEPEEIDQIFQTIKDYAFSIQQMENLNQLFGLSVKNPLPYHRCYKLTESCRVTAAGSIYQYFCEAEGWGSPAGTWGRDETIKPH